MFSPRLRCVTRTGACPPLPRGAAPCPARCPGPCVATSVPPPATGGIVVPNRARTRLVHGPSHLGGTFGWRAPPCFFLLPKTLNLKKKLGGYLSAVAFGSEKPLSENIYTFLNVFAATFDTTFNLIDL